MVLETVKIKQESKRGWVIINKTDFDKKTMELYGSKPVAEKPAEKEMPKKARR